MRGGQSIDFDPRRSSLTHQGQDACPYFRRIIRRVGVDNLDDMLALRIGDRLGGGALETSWRLELFKKRLVEVQQQPFSVTDLKISGFDVMQILNCKPGPIIGTILNKLFAEVEGNQIPNDKEKLIERINQIKASGEIV